jgi:HAD superfamily hydrolase (TIGR01509 family)
VDGTLVDTNYLHVLAWARVFDEAGVGPVPQYEVHRRVGMSAGRLLDELFGPGHDDLKEAHGRQFSLLHKEIRALPGASALLRGVKERGRRVVLGTSSKGADIEALLAPLDGAEAVDEIVNDDDVDEAKPDPEVFEAALAKGSLDPDRTMVVGDTVWDVKAATRAGLGCVCVLTGGIARAELVNAGAAAVYESAAALWADFDGSPLGGLLA